MRENTSLAYRPDIDGLRAVAVLAVVGYHAAPAYIGGGFAGVDVFFVISGFLITSIILAEKDQGRFSLVHFYARRIRRLFPALIAVLTATFFLAWFYLLPHEFRTFGKHMAAGAAYVINFTLKRESGYFDATADEKPLLHLWSLAVEEQFYIVWPLLLSLLLLLRNQRLMVLFLSAAIAASFAANVNMVSRNAAAAFFLPHYRFWELALGALLACAQPWLAQTNFAGGATRRMRDLASIVGVAVIAAAYWGLDSRTIYPGAWALLPCLGAVLIIAAGANAAVNRFVLARPLAVGIGLISYPLYLWHWPLLSLASILKVDNMVSIRLAIAACAVVLAWLTYRFVETPLRHAHINALPAGLFAGSLVLCALGYLSFRMVIPPRLNAAPYLDLGNAVNDWAYPDGLSAEKLRSGLVVRTSGERPQKAVFFGDSNVEQYWPRVRQILSEGRTEHEAVFLTSGGCPPIPGVRERLHPNCDGFAEAAASYANRADVKTVVIAASWTGYFNGSGYHIGTEIEGALKPGSAGSNRAFAVLKATMLDLSRAGKNVWLVLNIPTGAAMFPHAGLTRTLTGWTTIEPALLDRKKSEKMWAPVRDALIFAAREAGARVIDPLQYLCSADNCPQRDKSGTLMYKDGSHLRASFVREQATFIDQTLDALPSDERAK